MRGRGIWISFAILLLLVLVFVFAPAWLQIVAAGVLLLGVGLSIGSIARRQVEEYRLGRAGRNAAVRAALVETIRMFAGLALSIALAGRGAFYFIERVEGVVGFVMAVAAALGIGVLVNTLVRRMFALAAGKLNGRGRPAGIKPPPAQPAS